MRPYIGRIAGVAIGALAGPVGALFGFLAGWLVDQFRAFGGSAGRLERFLDHPEGERPGALTDRFAVAALVAAVAESGGPPHPAQVERALAEPWPTSAPPRRRRRLPGRQVTLDRCLGSRREVPAAAVAVRLSSWGPTEVSGLMNLLVAVACADPRGMSAAERAAIEEVGAALGVDAAVLRELERRHGGLDREACRILGVEPDADADAVRRAFRGLAAQLHPDTAVGLEPGQQRTMEDAFVRIRGAYDRLRLQLDARGEAGTAAGEEER